MVSSMTSNKINVYSLPMCGSKKTISQPIPLLQILHSCRKHAKSGSSNVKMFKRRLSSTVSVAFAICVQK